MATKPATPEAVGKRASSSAGKSKAGAKAPSKPAAKAAAKPAKPAKPATPEAAVATAGNGAQAAATKKKKTEKREKVVRDSFTMPKHDFDKIAELKAACLKRGVVVKKSELLRAGLAALAALPEKQLLAVVASVETVKTGRPSSH
jgi:hypothetical protein